MEMGKAKKKKKETVTKVTEEIRTQTKKTQQKNFQGHKNHQLKRIKNQGERIKAKKIPVNLRRRIEIGDQIQIERNSKEQLQQIKVFPPSNFKEWEAENTVI